MKRFFTWLNIGCYMLILLYIGVMVGTSLSYGHPWAVTCYNCGLCRQSCPIGLDPYGFIAAAIADDPSTLIQAVNVKLLPEEARLLDAAMPLITDKGERVDLNNIRPENLLDEVFVERMQTRYAAAYCTLCGNCERLCPIKLPIMDIIRDFRDANPL